MAIRPPSDTSEDEGDLSQGTAGGHPPVDDPLPPRKDGRKSAGVDGTRHDPDQARKHSGPDPRPGADPGNPGDFGHG